MIKAFQYYFVLQAVLTTFFLSPVVASKAVKAFPADWRYSGGSEARVKASVGQVVYDGAYAPAVTITSLFRSPGAAKKPIFVQQTFNNKLFKVDLSLESVLTFKAKFIPSGAASSSIKLQLFGPGLNLTKAFTASEGEAVKDGYYAFRWDVKNEVKPLGRHNSALAEVRFLVDSPGEKADDRLDVTIIDLGLESTAGSPSSDSEPRVRPSRWQTNGSVQARDISLKGWIIDNQEAAGGIKIENVTETVGGKKLPALRLTYSRAEKFSSVSLPLAFNADKENGLSFKAKVQAPTGSKQLGDVEAPMTGWYSYQFNQFTDNFGIGIRDKYGLDWTSRGVPRTHFLQHLDKSQPVIDGFKSFRWDMKNENPTGNKGFDLEEVSHLQLFYDNRKLQEGEKTVITIVSPQLVTGQYKTGGDEAKFEKFQKYIADYKPDYSDSSKYLGSPEQGRLEKSLAFIEEGKPVGEIVGTASVWNPEGNAVRELYKWLYRLSEGVEVPIVAKPTTAENIKIFIGAAHAKEFFADDIEKLKGSDGCAIRLRGNSVYIFGANGKGTLNGVYTFLEGNSDIIWPRPSELYEAIYSTNSTFHIRWSDYFHRAPARYWGWMGKTQGPEFDYQVRNRANYLGLRSDMNFKYWGLYMEEGGGA